MFNKKIRTYAKEKNVYLWQIADELNITDGNFSRKLRQRTAGKRTERSYADHRQDCRRAGG